MKKAIKNGEAMSIILAANIEQLELSNENVDHQVAEILEKGKEKASVINNSVCLVGVPYVHMRMRSLHISSHRVPC